MDLKQYQNIVVLTGAGISQAAGLPTYRGPGGLWTDPALERLSDVTAMASRREEACTMFWRFRNSIVAVKPTAAHRVLAAFEASLPETTRFMLITQNVDGLHQVAGSKRVCEYHGSLLRWRCEICHDEIEPSNGDVPVHCGLVMRPAAVLFGELIPPDADEAAREALDGCDLFVAIGTSGTVYPASGFVRWAELSGAHRMLLNLEVYEDAHDTYTECHAGPADELVPRMFG